MPGRKAEKLANDIIERARASGHLERIMDSYGLTAERLLSKLDEHLEAVRLERFYDGTKDSLKSVAVPDYRAQHDAIETLIELRGMKRAQPVGRYDPLAHMSNEELEAAAIALQGRGELDRRYVENRATASADDASRSAGLLPGEAAGGESA